MARAKNKTKAAAVGVAVEKLSSKRAGSKSAHNDNRRQPWSELFSNAACITAHWMGKPIAFLSASAAVIVWAATGPMFGYSDTWQLVINTSTTIVTFLMVFLIQNTQNRDTMALQLKLSELIIAMTDAENRFAKAEDLSDKELEELHDELRKQADETLGTLEHRRTRQTKKAS